MAPAAHVAPVPPAPVPDDDPGLPRARLPHLVGVLVLQLVARVVPVVLLLLLLQVIVLQLGLRVEVDAGRRGSFARLVAGARGAAPRRAREELDRLGQEVVAEGAVEPA